MYFILPDKIVGVAPRCGSRSVRAALTGFAEKEYSRGALNLKFDERPTVIFVRDPLDRFESGFRMLHFCGEILISYEGLVDAVLDGRYQNAHITLQAVYHESLFVDDLPGEIKLYPFEAMHVLWPDVVGVGELQQIGASNKALVSVDREYRKDELCNWLSPDYELRRRLVYAY